MRSQSSINDLCQTTPSCWAILEYLVIHCRPAIEGESLYGVVDEVSFYGSSYDVLDR